MKATGIVRRIDDLGRVVIPKEIRRTMRIREGDPLEIFTNKEGEVIFKKYSAMESITEHVLVFAEALAKQETSALPYIELQGDEALLDEWTRRKAIQKAIESRRITSEMKGYLRTLR